jgi:hypothetical protein
MPIKKILADVFQEKDEAILVIFAKSVLELLPNFLNNNCLAYIYK